MNHFRRKVDYAKGSLLVGSLKEGKKLPSSPTVHIPLTRLNVHRLTLFKDLEAEAVK